MYRALDMSACRTCSGLTCTPLAFAALTSSAPTPADCGEAIEVPLASAYPTGQVCARQACGCHSGVVLIAAPGATAIGEKPPSSRGPRELKVWRFSWKPTSTP